MEHRSSSNIIQFAIYQQTVESELQIAMVSKLVTLKLATLQLATLK